MDVLWLPDDDFDIQIALCMLDNVSSSGDTTASCMDITHHLVGRSAGVCFTCKVLTRVKTRLQAGLNSRRFLRMPKAAGDRHRLWGVTAAFVLQMSALRRFCGLAETAAVSSGGSGVGWKADSDDDSQIQAENVYCDSKGENAAKHECGRQKQKQRATTCHDEDDRSAVESSLTVGSRGKTHACPTKESPNDQQTKVDSEVDFHEKVVKFLTNSLNELRFSRAHDSAIDSTGFLEATDSDSSDCTESSNPRLKRSTSQDSVGSVTSESWGTVTNTLHVPRSISLDSLGSKASSARDSALATSEDEESESSSDSEQEQTQEPVEITRDNKLYAVDERHEELLGVIRWTNFQDLLKVLRMHAEEEEYVSAAGPGLCMLQSEKGEEPDIVEQALITALSSTVEEEDEHHEEYNIIEKAYLIAMASSFERDIENDDIIFASRGPSKSDDTRRENTELDCWRERSRPGPASPDSSDSEYEPHSSESDTDSESSDAGSDENEADVSLESSHALSCDCVASTKTTIPGRSYRSSNPAEGSDAESVSGAGNDKDLEKHSKKSAIFPDNPRESANLLRESEDNESEQQNSTNFVRPSAVPCWLASDPIIPFSASCSRIFNFHSDNLDDSQTEFWITGRSASEDQDASVVCFSEESRYSFEDGNRTDQTVCPGADSAQWDFSDTLSSSVSQALVDECTEASRWLEEHSADGSPDHAYGGRSSDDQCRNDSPTVSDRPFSLFSNQLAGTCKDNTNSFRCGKKSDSTIAEDLLVFSTPSLKFASMTDLDDVISPMAKLDESEISFGFTGRI